LASPLPSIRQKNQRKAENTSLEEIRRDGLQGHRFNISVCHQPTVKRLLPGPIQRIPVFQLVTSKHAACILAIHMQLGIDASLFPFHEKSHAARRHIGMISMHPYEQARGVLGTSTSMSDGPYSVPRKAGIVAAVALTVAPTTTPPPAEKPT